MTDIDVTGADLIAVLNARLDEGDDYYRQSTTACCPRETIPDSCSCLEGCECMCTDCICEGWGEDD